MILMANYYAEDIFLFAPHCWPRHLNYGTTYFISIIILSDNNFFYLKVKLLIPFHVSLFNCPNAHNIFSSLILIRCLMLREELMIHLLL